MIARAPDVIIGSWCGKPVRKERITARPGWQDVPAVRNGQIYEVKSTYILQPGPAALTEGVTQLHDIIRRSQYNEEMTRFAIVLFLTALAAACRPAGGPAASPAPSANAWAVVNGHEITRDDVEKAYRRAAPENQTPSRKRPTRRSSIC